MISLRIDVKDLQKEVAKLRSFAKNFPKETAASINKGLDTGKALGEQLIPANWNVSGVGLTVKKASAGSLTGEIKGSGGMKHVSEFSPSVSMQGRYQIVSVSIRTGSRKAILSTSKGPGVSGAFMVGGRVMERRQDGRYPIYPVMTIGIPQMLGARRVSDPVQEKIGQVTIEELTAKIMAL